MHSTLNDTKRDAKEVYHKGLLQREAVIFTLYREYVLKNQHIA